MIFLVPFFFDSASGMWKKSESQINWEVEHAKEIKQHLSANFNLQIIHYFF